MQIEVELFAAAKELAGSDRVTVEIEPEAGRDRILEAIYEKVPSLAGLKGSAILAVNLEVANDQTKVQEGDRLSVLPPVGGG